MSREQEVREAALRRHYGQTPAERERVAALNAGFHDWRGWCKHCRHERVGTIRELKTTPCPNCGAPPNGRTS